MPRPPVCRAKQWFV